MSKAIPPAVAAYTLEERQRLLDRIAELELAQIDAINARNAHQWGAERIQSELEACIAALPGTIYMDPPDGGDVPIAEQLRRMGEDAARWRAVMQYGEGSAFEWFSAKYVQRADVRQAALGRVYTEAETHDLAKSVMSWLRHCTLADHGFQPVVPPPAPGRPMYCAVRGVLRGLTGVGICGSVVNAELCGSTGHCKHQRVEKP